MKRITHVVAGILAFFLGAAWTLQAPPAQPGLERLAWLEGTWEQRSGERVTRERWLPAAGSMMLAVSHTYTPDRTRFFEFLRIERRKETLVYVAQPGGQPPVEFALAACEEGRVVFENPKHDHPQRIVYERTEKGVTATVELLDGSRAREFVFERK